MMKLSQSVFVVMLLLGITAYASEEVPYVHTVNVVYGETEGVGLVMDVFSPLDSNTAKKGLGVICIASGGWNSNRAMMDAHQSFGILDVLCRRGYVVFGLRPGSISLFTGSQMLLNVKTGIRYVKAHAGEYSIDPDRLGLVGISAGGHLSLLASTCADEGDPVAADPLKRFSTQVLAVGAFFPPTDFLDWDGTKYGLDLMQGRLVFRDGFRDESDEEIERAAKAISPLYHIHPGLPPFLLIHGDADSLVPLQQSVKFVDAVREQGGSAELIIKQGGDHSWPKIRVEVEKLVDWLDTQLVPHSVK